MGVKVYILNASGHLTPHKSIIQKVVLSTVKKASKKIALKNIDIIIRESDNLERLKDIDGVGGYCPSGYFV